MRIQPPAFGAPPAANRGHRERPRVMVGADIDEARVARRGRRCRTDRRAARSGREVVDLAPAAGDLYGPPLPARVLVVADEFLLLGVDRDHRAPRGQRACDLVLMYRNCASRSGMIGALLRLPVALQAVVQLSQQLRHLLVADRMVLRPSVRPPRPACSCSSTATAIPDRRGSAARPAPRVASGRSGSRTTRAGRPPPGRRIGPPAAAARPVPASPFVIVTRDNPQARLTSETPP